MKVAEFGDNFIGDGEIAGGGGIQNGDDVLNGGIGHRRNGFFGHQGWSFASKTTAQHESTNAGASEQLDESTRIHARSLESNNN